jgi:penicillin-insensitive murein endopeptidase
MKRILILTKQLLILTLVAGCAKVEVQKVQSKTQTTPDRPQVEKQLSPTDFTNYDTPAEVLNNYEPLPTEIKTKTGILQLGQTQFSKVNYVYNSKSLTLKIDGHLKILDKTKNTLSDLDFELYGNHISDQAVIQLSQKNRQDGAPVLRAKVTCLDMDSNENFICEKAVVDFFVLYQKQFYTDQFETQAEVKKAKTVQPEHTPEHTFVTEQNIEQNELQSEGTEDSLEGRYQGQVYTTNLEDFFSPEPAAPPQGIESEIKTESQPITSTEQSGIISSSDKTKKADQTKTKTPESTTVPKPTIQPKTQTPPTPTKPPKKETPTEKVINADYKQTTDGSIRAYNQAVGFPDKGSLRNATSILEVSKLFQDKNFFSVAFPTRERFYGTYEMSQIIISMGQYLSKELNAFRLYVGNISAKKGGLLNPHKSHQIGMDVDIAYPAATAADAEKNNFPVVVQQSTRKMNANIYSTKKTFELFKHAFKQTETPVDRIFVDKLIIQDLCKYAIQNNEFKGKDKDLVEKVFQNIEHVDGHGDHFHLRLKCTDAHPACRSKLYLKAKGCSAS